MTVCLQAWEGTPLLDEQCGDCDREHGGRACVRVGRGYHVRSPTGHCWDLQSMVKKRKESELVSFPSLSLCRDRNE